MPMIKFSYAPHLLNDRRAGSLADNLDHMLRTSIQQVRPDKDDYRIQVFGSRQEIVKKVSPLDIEIQYHETWNFSDEEKFSISEDFKHRIRLYFGGNPEELKGKIEVRLCPVMVPKRINF